MVAWVQFIRVTHFAMDGMYQNNAGAIIVEEPVPRNFATRQYPKDSPSQNACRNLAPMEIAAIMLWQQLQRSLVRLLLDIHGGVLHKDACTFILLV